MYVVLKGAQIDLRRKHYEAPLQFFNMSCRVQRAASKIFIEV